MKRFLVMQTAHPDSGGIVVGISELKSSFSFVVTRDYCRNKKNLQLLAILW